MSTVSKFLRDKASELRTTPERVAVETLVKEAGLSETDAKMAVAQDLMEKEAIKGLAQKGVNLEEAVKLVKAANIDVKTLANAKFDFEASPTADLMDKAAAYIDQLEGYVALLESESTGLEVSLQKYASIQQQEEIDSTIEQLPDSFKKVASVGAFTTADLAALVTMQKESPALIQKLAAATDESWSMGGPVGMAIQDRDPFLEFLMSPTV